VHDGAVDVPWEEAAYGWYLGETAPELLDLLERGARVVQHALPRSSPPFDYWSLGAWLSTVAVAGDQAGLQACARQVLAPDAFAPGAPADSVAADRTMATLFLDDGEAASRLLAAVPPTDETGPMGVQVEQFWVMLRAVVHGDPAALDAAARARYAARGRLAGRSLGNRRDWTFLLDRGAMGLMAAARRRGLTPTAGIPDMPVELLARAVPR